MEKVTGQLYAMININWQFINWEWTGSIRNITNGYLHDENKKKCVLVMFCVLFVECVLRLVSLSSGSGTTLPPFY